MRAREATSATLLPASSLDLPALVELFNAGFAEYLVPMSMDVRGLSDYVETNAIDLDCSRIAMEEQAVAFARADVVSALQLVALDAEAAGAALLAAAGGRRSVRLANVPEHEPASIAMRDLGAQLVARQYELRLSL